MCPKEAEREIGSVLRGGFLYFQQVVVRNDLKMCYLSNKFLCAPLCIKTGGFSVHDKAAPVQDSNIPATDAGQLHLSTDLLLISSRCNADLAVKNKVML